MRTRPALTFALSLALGGLALASGARFVQNDGRSVWGGVYTNDQAQRGAQAYAEHCAVCHGAQLTGTGEAKPLSGPEFLSNWNGLSVGDLFDRMRTTMPANAPKSLSRETYADVLAFVLKFDGFPAGESELDHRSEMLAQIRFDAFRPTASLVSGAVAETAPTRAADGHDLPDPYRADPEFFKLPPGRKMGSTSAVATDSKGRIWVVERCGRNDCAGSDLDPIIEFDAKGNFIKAFGRGTLLFPHGLFIDAHDNIWITDGHVAVGKGADVLEFSPGGKLLRTLGRAGVAKAGRDSFSQPNAVLVAPNGDIFVADGHEPEKGVARIVKLSPQGRFIRQFGVPGPAPGQMNVPHTMAMDSRGRLFVGDRWNSRIDIYDQDGKLIDVWSQFGRPSGVYIDAHDILYVTDSESRRPEGYGYHPGWARGIRVGSARTGVVTAFIPDTYETPDKSATSGGEGIWADRNGDIYSAQVLQQRVVRYTPRKG
ncbi:MAG TPA: c-type cytochrome [Caulobacteraceae bacterium]|jgi:sugar lactone lactonase YvrE/mono/diheme cytochrome c family protein|nr:c-type cytochrome [Caulobacteraceae bacterium]